MDAKLSKTYYSPQGYCKGLAVIKKLATTGKKWLIQEALWQIYLPAPKHILRPKFDVSSPNAIHQADLIRVVTKISSCRVNTTRRRGIKWLGISFGSIFLLFSNKSSRGHSLSSRGKSPAPGS